MDSPQTITAVEWFFGYGGNHIGLRRVLPGLRLIAACEIEAYAVANMVAKMEAGLLDAAPVWTDCRTFPIESFRGLVDIFIASYPCQGFSSAGQRKGQADSRFLWPWVLRAVAVIQPRLCFFENVEGHVTLGLSTVIADLQAAGYRVEAGIFSAAECGAPQQRKRLFVLAHSKCAERGQETGPENGGRQGDAFGWLKSAGWIGECSQPLGDAEKQRCGEAGRYSQRPEERASSTSQVGHTESIRSNEMPERCERQDSRSDLGRNGVGLADANQQGLQGRQRPELPECSGERITGPLRPLHWPDFVARPGQQQHQWEPPRVIKTQRGLGLFANGCSYRLGESGVTNESQLISEHHHKERAVEVLQALRRTIDEKALQRPFGGLWQLCAEAILRSGVRIDLFPKSARFIVSFAQTCSQVSWVDLPDMWDGSQCADAPHRRQSIEQLKAKLDDALRQLSHEVALGPREGYRTEKRNNIDELRLLGNGVYPATAERAFRTLLTRIEAK